LPDSGIAVVSQLLGSFTELGHGKLSCPRIKRAWPMPVRCLVSVREVCATGYFSHDVPLNAVVFLPCTLGEPHLSEALQIGWLNQRYFNLTSHAHEISRVLSGTLPFPSRFALCVPEAHCLSLDSAEPRCPCSLKHAITVSCNAFRSFTCSSAGPPCARPALVSPWAHARHDSRLLGPKGGRYWCFWLRSSPPCCGRCAQTGYSTVQAAPRPGEA
jgi:hypothetical protein